MLVLAKKFVFVIRRPPLGLELVAERSIEASSWPKGRGHPYKIMFSDDLLKAKQTHRSLALARQRKIKATGNKINYFRYLVL